MTPTDRRPTDRPANRPATDRRRRSEGYGRLAEALCRSFLRLKGYRILAHRLQTPVGEIDIVARQGRTLALVEVKARRDWQSATEAVNARQLGRLSRAARVFLANNPQFVGMDLRFDVMLVTPFRWPRHLPDAWRPQ